MDDHENKAPYPESPSEILRLAMKLRGWSQIELAFVLGQKNAAGINQILSGKRGISPEMAKMLASAFDMPAWNFAVAQAGWELQQAADPDSGVSARARVQSEYPLREMIKRGWIQEAGDLEAQLCGFFNVSTLSEIPRLAHAAKRTEVTDIPGPQLAWLFRVRQIASEMPTPPFSRSKLESAVERMKLMLGDPEEARHIPRILHECGVRFVIVEALPGSKIDGVCLWLNANSPVVGLSLRFDRIDNFWFVLRHECSHVLHGHGQDAAIVDSELDAGDQDVNEQERIANCDAAEFCVPQAKIQSFYLRKKPLFAERDVLAFAKLTKVHPGLVVGQLQKLVGRYDLHRKHLVTIRNHVAHAALVDGWGDVIPVG